MRIVKSDDPRDNHVGIALARAGKTNFQMVQLPSVIVIQHRDKYLFRRVAALKFVETGIART